MQRRDRHSIRIARIALKARFAQPTARSTEPTPCGGGKNSAVKSTPIEIPAPWAWHYRALCLLRKKRQRERDEHEVAACSSSPRGSDVVDIANDECEHDTLLAEISHENAELAEIEAALARLQAGTYGICEDTGEPIAAERLRAVPWTRFSQPAALRREAGSPASSFKHR